MHLHAVYIGVLRCPLGAQQSMNGKRRIERGLTRGGSERYIVHTPLRIFHTPTASMTDSLFSICTGSKLSMSKDKKAELTLVQPPETAAEIEAMYRALAGSKKPMTEAQRKEIEAILAAESQVPGR
jgi:hypothetical protein